MFAEDLGNGIAPLGGSSITGKELRADIRGLQPDVSAAYEVLRSVAGLDYGRDATLITDAVVWVGRQLAHAGRACFEIWRDRGQARLSSFPPERLVRMAGFVVQFIPHQDRELFGRRISVLRVGDTWIVEMPREFGGAHHYRRALMRLAELPLGARQGMIERMEQGDPELPGEILAYAARAEILAARATRQWGWDGRALNDDRFTEFLVFHRATRFHLAQALVREHIVGELNRLLPRLGIEAEIVIDGLPSSVDIRRILEEVSAGRMGLGEAWKASQV
jgi:hypothetical protein